MVVLKSIQCIELQLTAFFDLIVMCKKYYKLVRVQVLRSQLSYVGGILLCGCLEKLTPFLIKDILILVRNMMKHSHGWYFSSG